MTQKILTVGCLALSALISYGKQTVTLSAADAGKQFDGIGVVNGGGATAVLLKDYPERQRQEILDLVYKPMFGASVSALLVEIPGDGNSTQGSMPSHSHHRGDNNYQRGYTWWVINEIARRNPQLSITASAWSAPAWVGSYWSSDMVDYYLSWLEGLRHVYGIELDALACHNEAGLDYEFPKMLKKALRENGYTDVKLQGFDNWPPNKFDFLTDMQNDKELQDALDAVSAHVFSIKPVTPEQRQIAEAMGKPIWNSEDHIYLQGFDMLISIVKCFNENYIVSGATRVINWYDIAGVYPMQPYSVDPVTVIAHEPWSGNYTVREGLWGYAHYGQFTNRGWSYVDSGCKLLDKGGSMVTMRDPATGDYSIIIETKDAKAPQTLEINLADDMPASKLCVWQSDESEQFVRKKDIQPRNGKFTITLQPGTVYSLSTTTGQQKGSFDDIPTSKPFPMPYSDDFDSYTHPYQWGYLPNYTADIIGCFELVDRPQHDGQCIHQTIAEQTLSWAPVWHHYTIIGDKDWSDYEVSADVYLNPKDEAAIMGRVCNVGKGYGVWSKGYYLKIDDKGNCSIVVSRGKFDPKELIGDAEQQALILASEDSEVGGEFTLATTKVEGITPCQWHSLKLRFMGNEITGVVDGKEVIKANSSKYPAGMAGLMAPAQDKRISTPYFDNLQIRPLGSTKCTEFIPQKPSPLYE